jgi:Fur family ferric uptake transcriptional regulator
MSDAQDLRTELHEHGYRLTPQRQLVLEAVTSLGHASPEDVLASVREVADGVNASTVYRTLEVLEEVGLVRHSHLGSRTTWHSVEHHGHLHLVCRDCGRVDEAPLTFADGLVGSLQTERGFTPDMEHFGVWGRCAGCAEAGSETGAHGADEEQPR